MPSTLYKNLITKNSDLEPDLIEKIEEKSKKETTASIITPLTITYKNGEVLDLIYKEFKKDWFYGGMEENYFISNLAKNLPTQPAVKIYQSVVDESNKLCALLIEDFTSTHKVLPFPLKNERLTYKDYESILSSIVSIHAYFWNSEILNNYISPSGGPLVFAHFGSKEALDLYENRAKDSSLSYMKKHNAKLKARWKEKILDITIKAKNIILERKKHGDLTLIHGDFHPWNIALPSDKSERIIILDWETYKRGLGVYDVAYLLIHSPWLFEMDKESRIDMIQNLLKFYCEELEKFKIIYPLEKAITDFRISIVLCSFPYIFWDRTDGLSDYFTFFDDWNCNELLSLIES